MEGKDATDGGGHGGDERAVGAESGSVARCRRRPRPSAGGARVPIPLTASGRKEILPLLRGEAAGRLRATTIIEWLEERNFPAGSAPPSSEPCNAGYRTGGHSTGPDQEVYFPQEHPPGREAQLDFTHCNSLGVTIGGRRLPPPAVLAGVEPFRVALRRGGCRRDLCGPEAGTAERALGTGQRAPGHTLRQHLGRSPMR